jgi:hypothetical protein
LPVLNVLTRNARPNNFSRARALLGKPRFVRSKCCDDQGDIATVPKGVIGGELDFGNQQQNLRGVSAKMTRTGTSTKGIAIPVGPLLLALT